MGSEFKFMGMRDGGRAGGGNQDGLARLQSAAADFAHAEIARIAQQVIDRLRSSPANGTFAEVAARHLWDEYCWALPTTTW
jgi:hypothetical protein